MPGARASSPVDTDERAGAVGSTARNPRLPTLALPIRQLQSTRVGAHKEYQQAQENGLGSRTELECAAAPGSQPVQAPVSSGAGKPRSEGDRLRDRLCLWREAEGPNQDSGQGSRGEVTVLVQAAGLARKMADEAGGLKDQAPARREMSAFGALQDKVPVDTAAKAAPSADESKPREAGRRRRDASRTKSSSDLLRSWSDISAADAGPTASTATQAAEDERGRRKSSSISFGQDEVRVLSPSGRIVPETVQKLQQGIITAMQAKRTTLLKTFQFLNRAGRLRGVAKMEASVAWARLYGCVRTCTDISTETRAHRCMHAFMQRHVHECKQDDVSTDWTGGARRNEGAAEAVPE